MHISRKKAILYNMGSGRPKKTFQPWKGWEKEVLEVYRKGGSDTEIKAICYEQYSSFSNDLFARWMEEEPIFSEVIKKGRAYSRAWWERLGREYVVTDSVPETKKLNTAAYQMNMRNRYKWDKDTESNQTQPININFGIAKEDETLDD